MRINHVQCTENNLRLDMKSGIYQTVAWCERRKRDGPILWPFHRALLDCPVTQTNSQTKIALR